MKIHSVQTNNNNKRQSFAAIKSLNYQKDFKPKTNLEDAKAVKTFLESKPFQNLFKTYNVDATFARSNNVDTLTLSCKQIRNNDNPALPDYVKEFWDKRKKIDICFDNVFERDFVKVLENVDDETINKKLIFKILS